MTHFYLESSEKLIISQNLAKECKKCLKKDISIGKMVSYCDKYNDKRRAGKIKNKNGTFFLCCSKTKTTKLFRQKLEALAYAYPDIALSRDIIKNEIKCIEQQKVNRLVHNLSSINGYNIQEIYNFVPQNAISSSWDEQLNIIKKEIENNPEDAATLFLRIAKNNLHMKSEFSIYRKLARNETVKLETKTHDIRKVLLNVLHTFFSDFSDKHIYINVAEYNGKVNIDYETVQVAFYHLIENSLKYSKLNSQIYITFSESNTTITMNIKMTSLYIHPDEKEKIFTEGFSGKNAKKNKKDGEGIGLWRIKQMIELNHGKILVDNGELNNDFFAENKFSIILNK